MTVRSARAALVRSAVGVLVAGFGLILASSGPPILARINAGDRGLDVFLAVVGVLVFVGAGIAGVRSLASAARAALEEKTGTARIAPLATVLSGIGYVLLGLATLGSIGVPLHGLLLGGALTGVVIGIAAQQTLGNVFAGLVLMIVRPFAVGERVVLKGGALGGEYEGVVGDIGLFYVEMMTGRGLVALPNAAVLSAAVGPGARSVDPLPADGSQTEPKRRSRRT